MASAAGRPKPSHSERLTSTSRPQYSRRSPAAGSSPVDKQQSLPQAQAAPGQPGQIGAFRAHRPVGVQDQDRLRQPGGEQGKGPQEQVEALAVGVGPHRAHREAPSQPERPPGPRPLARRGRAEESRVHRVGDDRPDAANPGLTQEGRAWQR